MKKLIVALILTIAAVAAFAQATSVSRVAGCSVTANTVSFGDPVIDLQIATAGAIELRTWPGADRNYQKAQAEWAVVDHDLSADIATRNMAAYRRHIGELARRGPVTKAEAACLVKLSYEVR